MFRLHDLLSMQQHLLEEGFSRITTLWNSFIQISSYHDLAFFSPKMCRKNFENRFTNKNLTSKNVFEKEH